MANLDPPEGDVCEGAQGPLEHSPFFTDDGTFGSHDEHGEEVDHGDYVVVDEDTLAFPSHASEFGYDGDLIVDYQIDGDIVTFDVALPESCADACADAYAWALSAFASAPWTRSGGGVGRIMFGRAPGGEVIEAEEVDLWVTNVDGSEEQLLVSGAYPGRWSPDGSEVAIFCCDDGGAAHLLNPDTGEVRRLEQVDPTVETFCGLAWSPDGERLACEGYGVDDPSLNGIYSVRASDGGDMTRITSNPGGEDTPGEYSPDGTRLVFVRFEDEAPVGYFVTNVDGTGEPQQLTPDGMVLDDSHFGGSWSPGGDDILFVARESEEHHKAIWIVNADGGSPEQLPIIMPCGGRLGEAAEYGCYSPDWSPDGDQIVFTRSESDGSNETLWIVNADGSNPVQVTDGTDDNPSWGPPAAA